MSAEDTIRNDAPWRKLQNRGEAMARFDREHLRRLTLEEAIADLEDISRNSVDFPPPDPATWPLPVSLARLIARSGHGAR